MVVSNNPEGAVPSPELNNSDPTSAAEVSKRTVSGKSRRQPPDRVARKTDVRGSVAQTKKHKPETKVDLVLKRLRGAKGVTIESLVQATGWQAHSVRGFLSGTVKKRLGLPLTSEVGKDGLRRYRVDAAQEAG